MRSWCAGGSGLDMGASSVWPAASARDLSGDQQQAAGGERGQARMQCSPKAPMLPALATAYVPVWADSEAGPCPHLLLL